MHNIIAGCRWRGGRGGVGEGLGSIQEVKLLSSRWTPIQQCLSRALRQASLPEEPVSHQESDDQATK